MLKTLLKQIKQYRKASVLAAVFTVLEVILELIILMLMASVIDNGIESGNINNVYVYGLCMIMTAVLGLVCGVLAGRLNITVQMYRCSEGTDTGSLAL